MTLSLVTYNQVVNLVFLAFLIALILLGIEMIFVPKRKRRGK